MNDPNTTKPLPGDTEAMGMGDRTSTGTLARVSKLPPSVLRSAAPGYLLAGAAALAFCGWATWKVTRQTDAIHAAKARTPAVTIVESPVVPGTPALAESPPKTTGAAGSHVTMTGAVVPAPSATTATTEPIAPQGPEHASLAAQPATKLGVTAPQPPLAPRAVRASVEVPATGARAVPASPRQAPMHERRKEPTPEDNNPYDDSESTPATSPSEAPPVADTNHVFDVRK